MKIVWLTSESAPFAKTGGLADVSASLPKALAKNGHQVDVIMPYYPQLIPKDLKPERLMNSITVQLGDKEHKVAVNTLNYYGVNYYFIEYNDFYDRATIYDVDGIGYEDNEERFIFFAKATVGAMIALELDPDIVHANDWHTGLVPVLLKTPAYKNHPTFSNCKSVYTLHNLGYQGVIPKHFFHLFNLDWKYFNPNCLEFHNQINLLKAGILSADFVTTVSQAYASEILLPEFSHGIEGAIMHVNNQRRLDGIINGIDLDTWNPEIDKLIPCNYSLQNMTGKVLCRRVLQKTFGIELKEGVPIIGIIARLTPQKGVDLFIDIIDRLMKETEVQIVTLGSGDQILEQELLLYADKYPNRIGVKIGYFDNLSHLIEAGSDMFVMPSRYEPCGLNQMYSMTYGTVPIVCGTGGLDDTVINYSDDTIGTATGFKFYGAESKKLYSTIIKAIDVWTNEPLNFDRIIRNGMSSDFSWDHTASQYEQIYHELIGYENDCKNY